MIRSLWIAKTGMEGQQSKLDAISHNLANVATNGYKRGGVVFEDANVRVTAAVVDHPPLAPALAYRFDCADRSIVISGDTRPCPALESAGFNPTALARRTA